MRKKSFWKYLVIIVLVAILGLFLYKKLSISDNYYKYDVSNVVEVTNPGQGMYVQVATHNPVNIEGYKDQADLFLLAYDIYDYRDRPLSESKLNELRDCLETVKSLGKMAIIRPAYGFDLYEVNDAENFEIIEEHIQQMATVVNEYKNLVVCIQAGFFGPWGEWHSSKYMPVDNVKEERENRNKLLSVMLREFDERIPVLVRRPRFIRDAAADGIDISRIGYYDDGLLSTESDYGTYDDVDESGKAVSREAELTWIDENLCNPMGGEMPVKSMYSKPKNADKEFKQLHVNFLNLKYNEEVLDSWKGQKLYDENAYDYLTEHLGYRLLAVDITYPERIKSGFMKKNQGMTFTIENDGYGFVPKYYDFVWVFETENGEIIKEAGYDLNLQEAGNLYHITNEEKCTFFYSGKELLNKNIKRIGFSLEEKSDDAIETTTVLFANGQIKIENGIYFIITVNKDGECEIAEY
ncbi:MAG: DUF4874 domain-containing protein [Lachnospiraceae bacterium]|nr:DUF4874 domain-containing protein [Lachnospiraceae bacterium]